MKFFFLDYHVDLSNCQDYFIVAELLKSYFRDLKPPLLDRINDDLFNVPREISNERLLLHIKSCLAKLRDDGAFHELSRLMVYLKKVANNSDKNHLKEKNLGEIFSKYLLSF